MISSLLQSKSASVTLWLTSKGTVDLLTRLEWGPVPQHPAGHGVGKVGLGAIGPGLGVWVRFLPLQLTSCAVLAKSLNPSALQFPHPFSADNNTWG